MRAALVRLRRLVPKPQPKCRLCGHPKSWHTTGANYGCAKKVARHSINGIRFAEPKIMPCNCPAFKPPEQEASVADVVEAGNIDLTGWSVRQ